MAGRPGISLIASTADGGEPRLGVQAGSHEFQAPLSILNDTTADIASDTTLTFNNALSLMGNTLTKTGWPRPLAPCCLCPDGRWRHAARTGYWCHRSPGW